MPIMKPLDTLARLREATAPPRSPWSTSSLSPLNLEGLELSPNTREAAMSIPALIRARNLICTTAAHVYLYAERGGERLADQPAWISRSDVAVPPYHRMLWTIDDLLFYGFSLWRTERDYDGRVIKAARVPYDKWEFNNDAVVISGREVDALEYILIPGIHEGILSHGREVIPQALALARAVKAAAETPSPTVELHQVNDRPITRDEANTLIAEWAKAMRGANGGVAFTSSAVEVREHGAIKEHLLVEGRNALAIDIARLCSIPAPMIDASIPGSSITYNNASTRMTELLTFGVAPMIAAVTARLGMDDVVPRGVSITADSTELIEYLNRLSTQDDGSVEL